MELNKICLDNCGPIQIININFAINDINEIEIYDDCSNKYDLKSFELAYSIDSLCWSCYMDYETFLTNIIDVNSDFYIRIKMTGIIGEVKLNGESFSDYTTSLDTCFNFSYASLAQVSQNLYNPYANMENAISLQQQLTETVANVVGIACYYFKLSPNTGSKDITFKEYALMDVESVKQIKIIITDNQMPSSKPEFNDWGLDWQTDWETEISKGMFATAFGPTAQPQEGDLIYIPMMKRMWMVNEAYEEKKDAFMWNATTFKVALVKYQEKDSVDLKDTEAMVNSFVKNKYEDLFGDEENIGGGEEYTSAPSYNPDNMYPVFKSDATRKYMNTECIDFKQGILYYKGTMIADDIYSFNGFSDGKIVYQREFCSTDGTISFIITPRKDTYKGTLLEIGNLKIRIKQTPIKTTLSFINVDNMSIDIEPDKTWFVYLRYSQDLHSVELSASEYVHADIPIYKLQNHHYWFDIDNSIKSIGKYNIELVVDKKSEIILSSFKGNITNIKVFDIYVDNVSEILQMYPTNSNLLVNDTARKIVDLNGLILS